jgi:hypothetical protein
VHARGAAMLSVLRWWLWAQLVHYAMVYGVLTPSCRFVSSVSCRISGPPHVCQTFCCLLTGICLRRCNPAICGRHHHPSRGCWRCVQPGSVRLWAPRQQQVWRTCTRTSKAAAQQTGERSSRILLSRSLSVLLSTVFNLRLMSFHGCAVTG